MLLYDSDDERSVAAVNCINEGLKSGQLCVYASVGAYDSMSKWHTSNISSRIINYEENIRKGDLVIVDFKPFFESAKKGDLDPFWQLKAWLEGMLSKRSSLGRGNRMMVFADAACALSENYNFDECVALEGWWQNTHKEWMMNGIQNITVICPHPNCVLDATDSKSRIGMRHSLTLHLKDFKRSDRRVAKPIRVLIAESDPDMQYLYRRYMDRLGFEVIISKSGNDCINSVFNSGEAGFDVIILDANFNDMSGLQVAKKIKERLPDQKIIVTTTLLNKGDLDRKHVSVDVITKPFSLSKLTAMIVDPMGIN